MSLYLVTISYETDEPIWDSNYAFTPNRIQKVDAFNMEAEQATPAQVFKWEMEIQNRFPKWKRVRVVGFSKYFEEPIYFDNDKKFEIEKIKEALKI